MQNPLDDRDTRGVLEIDWTFFGELCRGLALRIARDYDPDLVLGIAKAGVLPGAVVASILGCEFAAMSITRRRASNRPTLVQGPPATVKGLRVLIVDETCDSGDTLKVALAAVRKLGPAEVRTAVSIKTGRYEPDYLALATENFIILPWDREVIIDGELTLRPEYQDKLEEFEED
jgi:hypoxanthine phosphoribosyltransferase